MVVIGNNCSSSGSPNGGIPQGTLSGPKCFLLYINYLESHIPLYKYVDDSTLFDICNTNDVSVMQESLDTADNWTNNNCMKIKSKTSKEIVICLTPDGNVRNSIPIIVIYGNIVETIRIRIRIILFCQHTTHRNSNVYIYIKRHDYIYADMEAPTNAISGRYHRATRKINYTDRK